MLVQSMAAAVRVPRRPEALPQAVAGGTPGAAARGGACGASFAPWRAKARSRS